MEQDRIQSTKQVELLVELVGDRINAQVAAHEKYSLAFIKILDTLDEIVKGQEALSEESANSLKDIGKEINEIAEDLRVQQEQIRQWKDVLIDKIEQYSVITHDRMEQIIKQMTELNIRSDKAYDNTESKFTTVIAKVEEISREHAAHHSKAQAHMDTMLHVPSQIASLVFVKQKWRKGIENMALYFLAIITIVGIFAALCQFGVFKVTWFGR